MSADMRGTYLAVPVKDRNWRPDGWRVYQCPVGNSSRAVSVHRGPLAGWRAKRRAAALNRTRGR